MIDTLNNILEPGALFLTDVTIETTLFMGIVLLSVWLIGIRQAAKRNLLLCLCVAGLLDRIIALGGRVMPRVGPLSAIFMTVVLMGGAAALGSVTTSNNTQTAGHAMSESSGVAIDKHIDLELIEATKKGNLTDVQSLLNAGADVDAKTEDGITALMFATIRNHPHVIRVLLNAGADVNIKCKNVSEAFTGIGHPNVVQILLDTEQNAYLQRNDRITALMLASIGGYQEIVQILLDAGADVNAKGIRGKTALVWAATKGYAGKVRILLDAGADVDAQIEFTVTALVVAVGHGYIDIVNLLVDGGADVNVRHYNNGGTPLMWAASKGHPQIVRVLLGAGADMNAQSKNGNTSLISAAGGGHADVVRILIGAGAYVKELNSCSHSTSSLMVLIIRSVSALPFGLL